MITFKIGILGAGKIAHTVADTLMKMEDFEIYAVASRDLDRANAFGDQYNVTKRYDSYEDLANDPEVELIYIATPHSHHAEHAKLCINAGKPVLVEKAFTHNSETAAEVLKLAQEKKVFCGEAMWLRYLPMMQLARELLKKNAIGDLRLMTVNLGYDLRKKERLTSPELAGGALLDLGVYPINAILMLMDAVPVSFLSSCAKLQTGVDASNTIQMVFPTGRMATAYSSMLYKSDNNANLYGTLGRMEIEDINNPKAIRIYDHSGEMVREIFPPEKQISGYEYEFLSARKAIILGHIEPPEMKHADTMNVMRFCDLLRKAWQVIYPLPGEEKLKGQPKANA
jgi:predicted dehydrogenase